MIMTIPHPEQLGENPAQPVVPVYVTARDSHEQHDITNIRWLATATCLLELLHLMLPLLMSNRSLLLLLLLLLLLGRLFLQQMTDSSAVILSQSHACDSSSVSLKVQASVAARTHLLLPVLLQARHRFGRLCGLVIRVLPGHGA